MASPQDSSMADPEEINNFAAKQIQRSNEIISLVEDELKGGQSEEDDPVSEALLARFSFLSSVIENKILVIFKFIHEKYSIKFPDLESSVSGPIDYCLAVKQIPDGKPAIDELCDGAISLDAGRKRLVEFVETRIGSTAPNLSAIVGISIAAKLVLAAGGLRSLSRMPLLFFGRERTGFGFRTPGRVGCLEDSDIYRQTPAWLRERVGLIIGMATGSAAGCDSRKSNRDGAMGRGLRDRILERIQKMKKWRKELMVSGSGKLRPKSAGKFKKQRNNGASPGSVAAAQELADQFGEMALATQSSSFSPTIEFSKMRL